MTQQVVNNASGNFAPDCSSYDSFDIYCDGNLHIQAPTGLTAGDIKLVYFRIQAEPATGPWTITWANSPSGPFLLRFGVQMLPDEAVDGSENRVLFAATDGALVSLFTITQNNGWTNPEV